MKDFEVGVILAVFCELLSEVTASLLWLSGVLALIVIVALALGVWRERRIDRQRLQWSVLVGVPVALGGYAMLLGVTHSHWDDLGGPLDWIVAGGLLVKLFLVGTACAYSAATLWRLGWRRS